MTYECDQPRLNRRAAPPHPWARRRVVMTCGGATAAGLLFHPIVTGPPEARPCPSAPGVFEACEIHKLQRWIFGVKEVVR